MFCTSWYLELGVAGCFPCRGERERERETTRAKCPKCARCFKRLDFFQTNPVPEIMSLSSPQRMSSVLCEGIYSYFVVTHGTKSTTSRKMKKRPLHKRSLKEVEKQKKAAKKELRLARRSGSPAEVVDSLATKFISLVCTHSRLKKVLNARLLSRDVKAAREKCHRDFRQFAREVLDSGSSQCHPSFGSEAATTFFSGVYHSQPKGFIQPEWILTPPPPEVELDCSPFTESELASVIKKMKAWSTPSPFDRIGYWQLAVWWLDLANAYGSVHHSLIDISLQHYYAPPQFLATVITNLSGKVITADWETPVIPLQKAVYQGDPLSVVIFNNVMNTLLDTISLRFDLGYQFSNSSRRVNILQYADDTCLVADSPASCQHQLDATAAWLQWSGMVAKCQYLSMKSSSGKLADPHLTLSGVTIPFSTHPVKFLSLDVQVP